MNTPIEFNDDDDHIENALLRLLDLTRDDLDQWIALSTSSEGDLLERLHSGWEQLRPAPRAPTGSSSEGSVPGPFGRTGRLWHAAIAENPSVGFARDDDGWSWPVRWDGASWQLVDDPPEYEEEYFEGGRSGGGYTAYRDQAGWRMEKAHRQVRELRAATGFDGGDVLDIGSGYGYFLAALDVAGFNSEGLEVSDHGRAVAKEAFGQDSQGGILEDHLSDWQESFDVVTGFDLIEHVVDPVQFLTDVRAILRPGGFVGLKTPSRDSPEADIFGPFYHSLKREHLVIFTPAALTRAAADAGLEPVDVTTTSHLLRGFVGDDGCRQWEAEGRGADIVAWYKREG
jgi:SAM-dependent methyltransferase